MSRLICFRGNGLRFDETQIHWFLSLNIPIRNLQPLVFLLTLHILPSACIIAAASASSFLGFAQLWICRHWDWIVTCRDSILGFLIIWFQQCRRICQNKTLMILTLSSRSLIPQVDMVGSVFILFSHFILIYSDFGSGILDNSLQVEFDAKCWFSMLSVMLFGLVGILICPFFLFLLSLLVVNEKLMALHSVPISLFLFNYCLVWQPISLGWV